MEVLRRENYHAVPLDNNVGYSGMVKVGNLVVIGSTSATNAQGDVEGGGDAYRQAKIIFKKIDALLKRGGAGMQQVVRVRFYVTDIDHGRDCLKAYSEWFKDVRPVITMVEVSALARVDRLVEIEADAFLGSYPTSRLTQQHRI